ncbi:hypothetical protein KO500_11595 [Cellulophaga baltica]|uniref:hypothetical protein n=1 Tax=Cellulophaga TaxID=104264 RepID=UPI001C076577|nr:MULTISPECIES: hypothetical protein [Cellulophaga]MBU2997083.1 hypothetical protein [Cellulophaga baltica]MDO6768481.1 hypothetical protein [Cellulophaga sp. 1_MG-2023]
MKTIKVILVAAFITAFAACKDTDAEKVKEEQAIEAQVDSLNMVETELDETVEEVTQKTEEVEDALMALDSI